MAATFENCDGALWHIDKTQDSIEVDSTIYKYENRHLKPDELGYKYHILTYKEGEEDSIEIMSAYIGDVRFFISNYSKAGYNGLMVKNKAIPKKDIREMFKRVLSNWDFPQSKINSIIKQV